MRCAAAELVETRQPRPADREPEERPGLFALSRESATPASGALRTEAAGTRLVRLSLIHDITDGTKQCEHAVVHAANGRAKAVDLTPTLRLCRNDVASGKVLQVPRHALDRTPEHPRQLANRVGRAREQEESPKARSIPKCAQEPGNLASQRSLGRRPSPTDNGIGAARGRRTSHVLRVGRRLRYRARRSPRRARKALPAARGGRARSSRESWPHAGGRPHRRGRGP